MQLSVSVREEVVWMQLSVSVREEVAWMRRNFQSTKELSLNYVRSSMTIDEIDVDVRLLDL